RRAGVFGLVTLLLDAENVDGALVAGEQVLAVLGIQECAECFDAADDEHEIVLAFEREHGVDEIVARALLTELHFEAVGEEGEEVRLRPGNDGSPDTGSQLPCRRREFIAPHMKKTTEQVQKMQAAAAF